MSDPETTLPAVIPAEAPEAPAGTALATRLDLARARSQAMAANASNRAREFVHDHPVASVAGGIVLGALIAGAFTRKRGAKAEKTAKTDAGETDTGETRSESVNVPLAQLAALGLELALGYAARAAAAGKDGVVRVEDAIGETLTQIGESPAAKRGADAGRKVATLAEVVLTALRGSGESALSKVLALPLSLLGRRARD